MLHFMSSYNNNNVRKLPEPEAQSSAARDDNPVNFNEAEFERFAKRWKQESSSQLVTQQTRLNNELPSPQSQYNPLNEPSPLGLRLRKSPSLLELAQKRLNQANAEKRDSSIENLETKTKRDLKAKARARASSSVDKLKASHFPASLLRIGRWEYVSKYEGDLVAKCYFSKHKIVWEVLDGGLKKKFEINWADIVGLKANCAADGPGNLTIVLDKPPLFFREINPQPRKHTQWRSTADFTDGEASTQRQHLLQCEQGMLDKHYEKLIQCDARLNFLSQQQDTVFNYPYFLSNASVNDQNMSGSSVFYLPEIYGNSHMASPSPLLTYSSRSVETGPLGLIHQDKSKEARSSSSGMSMDNDGQTDMRQPYAPGLRPNISISDLVSHIGNGLIEKSICKNLPSSDNIPGQACSKDMLESISQILLNDNQLTAASDEKTLMSRVNSLCCLLQGYQNGQQIVNDSSTPHHNLIPHQARNDGSTPHHNLLPHQGRNDGSTPDHNLIPHQGRNDGSTPRYDLIPHQGINDGFTPESILVPVNTTATDNQIISTTPGSSQMAHPGGNDNSNPESNEEPGLSRNDSFADLVHQLPRIASLPRFLFDISENGEILK